MATLDGNEDSLRIFRHQMDMTQQHSTADSRLDVSFCMLTGNSKSDNMAKPISYKLVPLKLNQEYDSLDYSKTKI